LALRTRYTVQMMAFQPPVQALDALKLFENTFFMLFPHIYAHICFTLGKYRRIIIE